MRVTTSIVLTCLLLAAAVPAVAAPPGERHILCGPNPERLTVLQARAASFQRRLERQRGSASAPVKSAPHVYQSGQVAVMDDDGTLIDPPRLFDLQGRGMQFLRRPKGMSAVRTNLDFKLLIGDRLELADDDSVLIRFPSGFRYPFGDEVYTSVWVNSDGNLTFGRSEAFSSRSLDSLLAGPPRLAPLYADLDPSKATEGNGVYVSFPPNRVRITWLGVPEFGDIHSLNSFQVTLFETGRATFVYGDEVETSDAVVGVSAFGNGDLQLMDYNEELPFRPPRRTAIAEEFRESFRRNDILIVRTFFQHFKDVYDHVILWLDFRENLEGGAFAFELNVQNEVRGIGLGTFDFSQAFGSGGRMRSFVQMGTLARFPDNPDQRFLSDDSTMSLMGQEAGHRWLAFVRMIENGAVSFNLLGRAQAHWSFFLDSEGSSMEGNDWEDRHDGSFISTNRTLTRYSELDQYIMGLIPPRDVPDFFYISTSDARSPGTNPSIGAVVQGQRVDVSVDDVIAAEGPRTPGAAAADKSFRMAFVLVGRIGEPVPQESIDHLETIRQRWETWYPEATDFHGEVKTTLFPK